MYPVIKKIITEASSKHLFGNLKFLCDMLGSELSCNNFLLEFSDLV